MEVNKLIRYTKEVLKSMPLSWLNLTTYRLDTYNEKLAKSEFLKEFEALCNTKKLQPDTLIKLPTAYDYVRLGHPLSCILEWVIAKLNNINPDYVISFASETIAIMAILRKNALENKNTQIVYKNTLPNFFNTEILQSVYGYKFILKSVAKTEEISDFKGSTIYISHENNICDISVIKNIDFQISIHSGLGSNLLINGNHNKNYIQDIQHVRRRETIAMPPNNCIITLKTLFEKPVVKTKDSSIKKEKILVLESIKTITHTTIKPLISSSGLSIQYAILMGLIHNAMEVHKGKEIKIIVPPNCYGGTNDQARRVAKCLKNVEILDLPVDAGNDMVKSIAKVLNKIASEDAIPLIIAEIPTNPRVEVPDLVKLKHVLTKKRKTKSGNIAVEPVFVLDQTFCPNVNFLGKNKILATVKTISYVSGSKFPSGGKCTAGYCVGNNKTEALMKKIETHLRLCDNEATTFQIKTLAKQLPSMNKRIIDAYINTREFVNFIKTTLPEAKINFVSEELAAEGFTPSVFSIDLPTKGNSNKERESYKRDLNHKLINLMITKISNESKHCVSYGQLNGSYWTIPATSTQGTTKENDKDYIIRASLSPNMDVKLHKKVFLEFVEGITS